jgi:hypothetical protein
MHTRPTQKATFISSSFTIETLFFAPDDLPNGCSILHEYRNAFAEKEGVGNLTERP